MKTKKRFLIIAALMAALLSLSSCYAPSPLYGTWMDNNGTSLMLMNTMDYSLRYNNSQGIKCDEQGTWAVQDNVINFSTSQGVVVSEWDLRGAILFLTWKDNTGTTINMQLYHTAK